jgi:hypothetical protein
MKLDLISFIPAFLHAFLQNLWIGCLALIIGIALGVPFALIVHKKNFMQGVVKGLLVFLRALPVFIVMYISLGILTMTVSLNDASYLSTPVLALLIGLCFTATSGVYDATLDALRLRDAGQIDQALLIIPNIFRVFVSVASTTSVGAAIGVKEAVSYSLATAERMTSVADRVAIVLFVSLFFVCFVLLSRWLLNVIVKSKFKQPG